MYSIVQNANSDSQEAPVSLDFFENLINEYKGSIKDSAEVINYLLTKLQEKSSKHKFLVEITQILSDKSIHVGLNISSKIGTLWNQEKDGYISFIIELKDQSDTESKEKKSENTDIIVVTVIWIYTS